MNGAVPEPFRRLRLVAAPGRKATATGLPLTGGTPSASLPPVQHPACITAGDVRWVLHGPARCRTLAPMPRFAPHTHTLAGAVRVHFGLSQMGCHQSAIAREEAGTHLLPPGPTC